MVFTRLLNMAARLTMHPRTAHSSTPGWGVIAPNLGVEHALTGASSVLISTPGVGMDSSPPPPCSEEEMGGEEEEGGEAGVAEEAGVGGSSTLSSAHSQARRSSAWASKKVFALP